MRVLDEQGIQVSTGSACASRRKDRERALRYMGVPVDIASSSIRISIGASSKTTDLERLIAGLKDKIPTLVKIAR